MWEHPTSLLATPTALALVGRRPFSWPRPNINAALGAALFRSPTKQLHDAGGSPSRGLGLLSRSVELTNHRRFTNPAKGIKGDRLRL